MSRCLLLTVLAASLVACDNSAALCRDWASPSCPAEYPNRWPGISEEACNSNFRFACRSESCDREHEAMILCQTEYPSCCNDTECEDFGEVECATEQQAWWDCTSRLRDVCDDG